MNEITKVSDITAQDLGDYIHLPEITTDDTALLNNLLLIAKNFIQSYTGLTAEQTDEHADFVIVVFILVQDMWDNRTLYVDTDNVNKVVDTILGMHAVNLL